MPDANLSEEECAGFFFSVGHNERGKIGFSLFFVVDTFDIWTNLLLVMDCLLWHGIEIATGFADEAQEFAEE